jgi:hypothetical protein
MSANKDQPYQYSKSEPQPIHWITAVGRRPAQDSKACRAGLTTLGEFYFFQITRRDDRPAAGSFLSIVTSIFPCFDPGLIDYQCDH